MPKKCVVLPKTSTKLLEQRLYRTSAVKNKLLKQALFQKERFRKSKEKRERRKERKKEREELGDQAPKPVQRTLENTREPEETIVLPDDDEVLQDEKTDELADLFDRKISTKILILSYTRPSMKTNHLMRELASCIPNSEIRLRKGADMKHIIPMAVEKGFTAIISLEEHHKIPNGFWLIHLPQGPTAYFKLTKFTRGYDIKGHGRTTDHKPEIILNNFTTRLGHTVARMLAALFPQDPQFHGRRVATFHCQRDYIFFRQHRYIFRNAKKVSLQELGPRFTLKLRTLQEGTFDTEFGEYVWMHKRKQMDTSRRRFHL